MQEVNNILRILREAKQLIEKDNPYEIRSLSDQTIHSATISQDPDNIIVAVLVYALGKVMERDHYRRMEGWEEFHNVMNKNLQLSIKALEESNIEKWRTYVGRIRNSLNKIDGNLGTYIKEVFRKAEINKAFKMYEHGLSSEQTAELLGVNLWDLASYIGQSSISNAKIGATIPIQKRIKMLEEFFG